MVRGAADGRVRRRCAFVSAAAHCGLMLHRLGPPAASRRRRAQSPAERHGTAALTLEPGPSRAAAAGAWRISWRMAPAWSTASPEPQATFEWKPESARSIGSRWSAKRRTFSLASTRWRLRSGSAEKRATLAVALSARHRSELTSCTHGAPVYGQASPASALYSQK